MKHLYLIILLFSMSLFSFGQATDLFFSEYVEGSSSNRALEIYNGTGAAVDLSDYVIMQGYAGDDWGHRGGEYMPAYVTSLSGTLADGDVYIIYNPDAADGITSVGDLGLAYNTDASVPGTRNASFTGDDAMGLFKVTNSGVDTTLLDAIGLNTGDPGDGWDVAGVTEGTIDHTLVRKLTVIQGNTDWTASAGTNADDSEWIVFENNVFDFLGYHGESSENDILTFTHTSFTEAAVIDATAHTVTAEAGFGTDLTTLEPTITVSFGAQVSPTGPQDFSTAPVVYTVGAENGDEQEWTATVTLAEVSSEAYITDFFLREQNSEAIIDTTNKTIDIEVVFGTDVTSLKPIMGWSYGATINPDTTIARDFTNPVVYIVTAENGVTENAWTVTVTVQSIDLVSIYDIQHTMLPGSDSSAYGGETVFTTGTVTAVAPGEGFYIQDSAKAWNGIYVYTPAGDIGVIGDSVKFSGYVSEYYGLTELSWIENYEVISSDNESPEPIKINIGQMGEAYEGVFIGIDSIICSNDTIGHEMFTVTDGIDSMNVDDDLYDSDLFNPVIGGFYNIIGIGTYTYDEYKILPRSIDDITILANTPPVIDNIFIYQDNSGSNDIITGIDIEILAYITDDVEVTEKHFFYGFSLDAIDNELTLDIPGVDSTRFRAIIPSQDDSVKIYFNFTASDIEFTAEYLDSVIVHPVPDGISNILIQSIKMYPNPVNEELSISFSGNVEKIEIFNIVGEKVYNMDNVTSNLVHLNVSQIQNGVYFVNFISEDLIITRRFIKK